MRTCVASAREVWDRSPANFTLQEKDLRQR